MLTLLGGACGDTPNKSSALYLPYTGPAVMHVIDHQREPRTICSICQAHSCILSARNFVGGSSWRLGHPQHEARSIITLSC